MATVRVREVTYHSVPIRTRMPFRYGIAELRETQHLFVRAVVEVAGNAFVGTSADNLPPKWFTKDPNTTLEEEIADMMAVIRAAGRHATDAGALATVAALSDEVYARQKAWAAGTKHPPLLWNFGVSLIERAAIDAFCRGHGVTFHDALRDGSLGMEFPAGKPMTTIRVRHTVGLGDPLVAADVALGERLNDGLPQTLDESIATYGLRYFKIKLGGDVEADRARLLRLSGLLPRVAPGYAYTLDGNENFRDVGTFRALWESLVADRRLEEFLSRLIFVEQPLHRDVALATDLREWEGRPPIIIDESDAEAGSLETALGLGYVGTSHKNCKGVFKGLRNATLLKRRGGNYILSGEDLTNVGPVALLQDLAVLATLGVTHAERNGQHYVRGLSPFPAEVQEAVLAHHADLYERHPAGFAAVRVTSGTISTESVSRAPFGYGMPFDPKVFPDASA